MSISALLKKMNSPGGWAIIPAILCCLLAPSVALAQSNRQDALYHLEQGKRLLAENRSPAAAEEFIRALFADPRELSARQNLAALAQAAAPQNSKTALQWQYFMELADYVRFLDERLDTLMTENDSLMEVIGRFQTLPNEKMVALNDKRQQAEKKDASAQPRAEDGILDCLILTDLMTERKNSLLALLAQAEDVNNDLRDRKKQIHTAQRNRTAVVETQRLVDRIKDLELTRIRKEEIIEQQTKNISLLSDEIHLIRRQFAALQKKFDEAQTRIDDLTQSLAGTTLEIVQRDQNLANKEQLLTTLKGELVELRERSGLMQRIIQEKQAEKISGVKADYATRVQNLERQYTDLNQRYLTLEKNLTARETEIAHLRQEVRARDDRIANLKNAFLQNERQVDELLGVLEIYRSKLGDTLKTLDGMDTRQSQFQPRASGPQGLSPVINPDSGSLPLDIEAGRYSLEEVLKRLSSDLQAIQNTNE